MNSLLNAGKKEFQWNQYRKLQLIQDKAGFGYKTQCRNEILIYCFSALNSPFFALLCDCLQWTTNCETSFFFSPAGSPLGSTNRGRWNAGSRGRNQPSLFSAESEGVSVLGGPSSVHQRWQLAWLCSKWPLELASSPSEKQAQCSRSSQALSSKVRILALWGSS